MYYTHRENSAGTLRSKDLPEKVSEEIAYLAKRILSEQQYQKAEELTRKFSGTRDEKSFARSELMQMLQPPPVQPLYYAQWEAQFLPRWARDTVRILGDFVYKLLKVAVYEKTGDTNMSWLSLKQAIDKFDRCWNDSSELTELLKSFNSTIYGDTEGNGRPLQKHQEHRFIARDAVLLTFVAMALADNIMGVSRMAQKARLDENVEVGI